MNAAGPPPNIPYVYFGAYVILSQGALAVPKNMMIARVIIICCISLAFSGCVPIVMGSLMYKNAKANEQKREFMTRLEQTNMERESLGLAPLDWCSEAYRFNKKWAIDDAVCAARISAYEAGDKAALKEASLSMSDLKQAAPLSSQK